MVKMSETIICQRFIQNAWKKDLCSNCFKSKEDHVVLPDKKISYRWTSHVNNFPQHGILRDGQKNGEEKLRSVSFQINECEVIGFGGEEYSSDDEFYAVQNDDTIVDGDNEDEDREFRRLTQCNTDFNSIPANLKTNKVAADIHAKSTYQCLKLGKPQLDADGRRQTLHVNVEPFKNSFLVNGAATSDRKIHLNKILDACPSIEKTEDKSDKFSTDIISNKDDENDDCVTDDGHDINNEGQNDNINGSNSSNCSNTDDGNSTSYRNDNCSNVKDDCVKTNGNDSDHIDGYDDRVALKPIESELVVACGKQTVTTENTVNILNVGSNETVKMEANVQTNGNLQNGMRMDDDKKYLRISNVLVNVSKNDETVFECNTKVAEAENTSNTRTKACVNGVNDKTAKFSVYQGGLENETNLNTEKRVCSMNKDCNPICLPLIMSKELEIEYDEPGSRELVGEPDGKADSDDSSDPLLSADDCDNSSTKMTPVESASSVYVNPQRSFLHGFNKDKPKPAIKPVTLAAINVTPKKSTAVKDLPENTDIALCSPNVQIPVTNCNGTGSTKRQAPKPPSPKFTPTSSVLSAPALVQKSQTFVSAVSEPYDDSARKCDSPLVNGMRDAISFLGVDHNTNSIKRKLNLDSVISPNRSSLNVCVSVTPNSTNSLQRYMAVNGLNEDIYMSRDIDTESITSIEQSKNIRNSTKCSRSLSCDSIVSPNGLALSEKSRKYAAATVKVKSTIRKFLRFSSKEGEKAETDTHIPVVPRRRIEIIHPLDLNKSSIEILRTTTPVNGTNGECDVVKKTDNENGDNRWMSPASNVNHSTCPMGRPTKPPPPPRTQSLDQKFSEISKPVRPPPPKSVNLKPLQLSNHINIKTRSNLYENIGESRHGIAPAKPQRASSMRDRSRQHTTVPTAEENMPSLLSECEAVPECDQNQQQLSDSTCESPSPPTSSLTYCGSETESDVCFQLLGSHGSNSSKSEVSNISILELKQTRRNKSIMHSSLEDNYGAVVVANHEALSRLSERVNQATLIPNSLKVLQTTLHIRFDHLTIVESSKIVVADWHFYNGVWSNQNVVVSISTKHLAPMKSLPSCVTLYPLLKFTDLIPASVLKHGSSSEEKINAYITIWNEERIESFKDYCTKLENTAAFNECGLLLMQLTNSLKHLQACGIEDISLKEIFICKRKSGVESKLLLLPFSIGSISSTSKNDNGNRMSLCKCISTMSDVLLPKQQITEIVKRILTDETATSLSQTKAVVEYWLWGPGDVTLTTDRQTSLQRWLDLERANYLHKLVCKPPSELTLHERCHMMFLVQTNAKTLTDASYLLENLT